MRQKVKQNASGAPELSVYSNKCTLNKKKAFKRAFAVFKCIGKRLEENLTEHFQRVRMQI